MTYYDEYDDAEYKEVDELTDSELDEIRKIMVEYINRECSKDTVKEAIENIEDIEDTLSTPLEAIHEAIYDYISYNDESSCMELERMFIDDAIDEMRNVYDNKFGDGWEYSSEADEVHNAKYEKELNMFIEQFETELKNSNDAERIYAYYTKSYNKLLNEVEDDDTARAFVDAYEKVFGNF